MTNGKVAETFANYANYAKAAAPAPALAGAFGAGADSSSQFFEFDDEESRGEVTEPKGEAAAVQPVVVQFVVQPAAAAEALRPAGVAAPTRFERFEKDEAVEYKSEALNDWVSAVVLAVDPETGAIQLDVKLRTRMNNIEYF